jgi:uncharacterized protein (TIGR01319 family)
MRWSAVTTVVAARDAGLAVDGLEAAADRRTAEPAFRPGNAAERAEDEAIATAAVVLALRRHAGRSRVVVGPGGKVVERTGKDLREVDVLVGSGGVLRTAPAAVSDRILRAGTGPQPEGWQLPEDPRVVVDADYVLAAVGLLALARPEAASRFVDSLSGWRGNR